MFTIKRAKIMVIVSAVLYVFMIVMNALAVMLPLNGLTTQMISARYDTLFAPTGLTFSIWGVIYLALAVEVVLNFLKFKRIGDTASDRAKFTSNIVLALTSLINGVWIVFWHYEILLVTLILMLALFGLLAFINIKLKTAGLVDRLPYSLYFGWITIALIANVGAYIVSHGIMFKSVGAVLQTTIIIIVASFLAAITIFIQKDYAYGLVIAWALLGIVLRHYDSAQFDLGYVSVANAAIFGLCLTIATIIGTGIFQFIKPKRVI
jgi:hypothetical protein